MTSPQEIPYVVVDVVIDCPIRRIPISTTEIVRPPPQNSVEAISHFRPWFEVTARQQVSHFLPQPGNALFRRTFSDKLATILPHANWPECVPQKVKPLCSRLLDAGLRLVQR